MAALVSVNAPEMMILWSPFPITRQDMADGCSPGTRPKLLFALCMWEAICACLCLPNSPWQPRNNSFVQPLGSAVAKHTASTPKKSKPGVAPFASVLMPSKRKINKRQENPNWTGSIQSAACLRVHKENVRGRVAIPAAGSWCR